MNINTIVLPQIGLMCMFRQIPVMSDLFFVSSTAV